MNIFSLLRSIALVSKAKDTFVIHVSKKPLKNVQGNPRSHKHYQNKGPCEKSQGSLNFRNAHGWIQFSNPTRWVEVW
jgi:hypothetical protein